MFAEPLLDHFQHPRNVGAMACADAEAEDENRVCGDRLHLWLRFGDGRIIEASWKAEGCAPAIAAASVTSEMLRGMTVDEARSLNRERISVALGGLPARKAHAAMLVVAVVKKALEAAEGNL